MTERTMRAVRIEEFGGPDVLTTTRLPVPDPGPDEVLIRVSHCGVCRHDLLTRAGAFPGIDLPVTLGHQVSGVVDTAGADTSFTAGDRVMTMIYTGCGTCSQCTEGNDARCLTVRPSFLGEDADGGYAEYVCVKARTVVTVPPQVSLEQAAILTCTLGTAHHALRTRGRVEAGDHVVITGASGGVGLHAIRLAKLYGADVTAVVSSDARREAVIAAGADDAIVSPERKFAKAYRGERGRGADVVLDIVGAATLRESLHCIRDGGTVVVLGNVEGAMATIPPAYLILKEASLVGTKSCTTQEMAEVLGFVADGTVDADVTEVIPLADAAVIHDRMERGQAQGRFVLANTWS